MSVTFTRKHFQAFIDCMSEAFDECQEDDGKGFVYDWIYGKLSLEFVRMFKADNPRFDQGRFGAALEKAIPPPVDAKAGYGLSRETALLELIAIAPEISKVLLESDRGYHHSVLEICRPWVDDLPDGEDCDEYVAELEDLEDLILSAGA